MQRSGSENLAGEQRYIDWRLGGYHPKTLEVSDVPEIIASGAHFARKFAPGGCEVLDELDRVVGGVAHR